MTALSFFCCVQRKIETCSLWRLKKSPCDKLSLRAKFARRCCINISLKKWTCVSYLNKVIGITFSILLRHTKEQSLRYLRLSQKNKAKSFGQRLVHSRGCTLIPTSLWIERKLYAPTILMG